MKNRYKDEFIIKYYTPIILYYIPVILYYIPFIDIKVYIYSFFNNGNINFLNIII